jgi:serine phosphatase RsbU (regulator of sigma subunit)/anti-sigma regulatory factor (Ser/Thr protein kinase)
VFLGSAGTPPRGALSQQLLSVYRLSDPSLSELTLQRLLDELLVRIRNILAVDTVAVLLLDDEGQSLVARAAKGLEEEVDQGVRIPLGKGFAGRIAAERASIFIADVDHADVLNPILREKGVRSLLGVPLIVEGQVVGVLHVGSLQRRTFSNADAALLQLAAARAAPAIERAQLFDALEREHRGAVALQRSLLPDGLPDIVGVDVAARYLPARDEVGGDWYDVIELPQGRIGVAIGDVAGHGVRAAALMGQLRTGLRAYASEGHGPAESLLRLDRLLQTLRGRSMATVAYAIVDPDRGELRLATAGHLPPVIASQDRTARVLEVVPAPPLGTVPFPIYDEVETTLACGEILLLYTDGLVESRDEALTAGLERLRAAAAASRAATADELCSAITKRFVPAGGAPDDVALVALRSMPMEEELQLRVPAEPEMLAPTRRVLRRWLRDHGAGEDDLATVTLAVGEACANAVEHAYSPGPASFDLHATHEDGVVTITVRDSGRWRDPRGTDRGRGMILMEASMDVDLRADPGGSEVVMKRRLGGGRAAG